MSVKKCHHNKVIYNLVKYIYKDHTFRIKNSITSVPCPKLD